jgi:hypothetical protein
MYANWACSSEAAATDDGIERVNAGPVCDLCNQVVFHGVGQGVDHLVKDIGEVDEAQNASLFRRCG